MLAGLPRIAEMIFARVAPGVLNLVSIVLIGRYLDVATYGLFSTTIATTAVMVLVLTGPVQLSIIPRRAVYEAQGNGQDFERGTLSLLLLTSACVGSLGIALWLSGAIPLAWVALALSSSIFDGWTPVLRARLQFWRYGVAAWIKAIATIMMIYFFVSENPTSLSAIWAYTLGNAIGFLAAWLACGSPMPKWVKRADLKGMVSIGSSFTVSNLAESGLLLGTRYVIIWFGSDEFLGLFTYAVDIAQRSIGVVINIISFAIVPRAYKISAQEGPEVLISYLKRAGSVGAALAAALFSLIFILGSLGWIDRLLGSSLSMPIFTAVSIAVASNRLKKMVIDPIAVALDAHGAIPFAYLLVAPISIGLSAWFAFRGQEDIVTYIYPTSYVCVACITSALVLSRSRISQ